MISFNILSATFYSKDIGQNSLWIVLEFFTRIEMPTTFLDNNPPLHLINNNDTNEVYLILHLVL